MRNWALELGEDDRELILTGLEELDPQTPADADHLDAVTQKFLDSLHSPDATADCELLLEKADVELALSALQILDTPEAEAARQAIEVGMKELEAELSTPEY